MSKTGSSAGTDSDEDAIARKDNKQDEQQQQQQHEGGGGGGGGGGGCGGDEEDEEGMYVRKKKDNPKGGGAQPSPRTATLIKSKKAPTTPRDKKQQQQQQPPCGPPLQEQSLLVKSKRPPKQDPAKVLSEEILFHVFFYLEGNDLLVLSLISHSWNRLAENGHLWKQLFTRNGWKIPTNKAAPSPQSSPAGDDVKSASKYTFRGYYIKSYFVHVNDWRISVDTLPASKSNKIVDVFKKKKNVQVLLMGLDGAGKTVALYQLKMGETIDSVPTVGTIEEQVKYQKATFNIIEIGGHKMMHQVWKQYLSNADAILWMVDASDKHKLGESSQQLHEVDDILWQQSRPALLGVLINKNDAPGGAVSIHHVISELELERLHFKAKYVQCVSSTTSSKELWIMIDWIYSHLSKLKKS